jgi:ATP-dependent DNA helicase PIF1
MQQPAPSGGNPSGVVVRRRGWKRKKQRHITWSQQLKINRERNIRMGLIKRKPDMPAEGTPFSTSERQKIDAIGMHRGRPIEIRKPADTESEGMGRNPSAFWGLNLCTKDEKTLDILGDNETVEILRAVGNDEHMMREQHKEEVKMLGPTQRLCYKRAVDTNHTLFITGGAGTGKSFLLRCIIRGLQLAGRSTAVLAPTGVAAHHIEGATVHSFFRLAPIWYDRPLPSVIQHFKKKREKLWKFQLAETIVIDEISMVTAKMLIWLDRVLQIARNNPVPFGGVQIIVCGDFFQLPPVSIERKGSSDEKDARARPQFCFETDVWRAVFTQDRCVDLKESFRQKDPKFIQLLNNARRGALTANDLDILSDVYKRTRLRLVDDAKRSWRPRDDGLNVLEMSRFRVRLFSTCAQVEGHNEAMKKRLQKASQAQMHTYRTSFVLQPWTEKQLLRMQTQRSWFETNKYRLGKEQRAFFREHLQEYEVPREQALDKLEGEIPVPEVLEFCVGMRVMLMKNWQTGVGLVHGRTGWIVGFGISGPKVVFDDPKLDWTTITEEQFMEKAIEVPPLEWSAISVDGRVSACQVPLSLAFAMTIHKSQGLSMQRADLDLASLFEAGQGYVAMSRLTSLEGFGLLDLKPKNIFPDPKVLQFYNNSFIPTGAPVPLCKPKSTIPAVPPPLPPPLRIADSASAAIQVISGADDDDADADAIQEKEWEPQPASVLAASEDGTVVGALPADLAAPTRARRGDERFASDAERRQTEELLLQRFGEDFVALLNFRQASSQIHKCQPT